MQATSLHDDNHARDKQQQQFTASIRQKTIQQQLSQFWIGATSSIMAGRPKFTKTCEAYLKMVEMLDSGEIDPGESPRLAYQKHPLFQQYDLPVFRAGLNKYKATTGYYTRNKQDAPPGGE